MEKKAKRNPGKRLTVNLTSVRCKKSACRRTSGPAGRGSPRRPGAPVRVRLRAARPRPALQTTGGAAQAAAAAGADGLQQSPAPEHGGWHTLRRSLGRSGGGVFEHSYLLPRQYLVLLKKLPAEDSLSPEEFDSLLRPLA